MKSLSIGVVWLMLSTFLVCAPLMSAGGKAHSGPYPNHFQKEANRQAGVFHSDPDHIWNRVHRCLLVRQVKNGVEYGDDTLDPLLFDQTSHLLTGESHQHALDCLDEFLRSNAEQKIQDPVKRAIFERDLWAVFDWSAALRDHLSARRALQMRLAEVMHRLALSEDQLRSLPDTYARAVKSKEFAEAFDPANPRRPFLPPDLFSAQGPWVLLGSRGGDPLAPQHVGAFSGRSRFLSFIRLPEGRKATLEYLHRIRDFPERLTIRNDRKYEELNPKVPQFPVGTMVAFVRQMILFDKDGNLVATPMTESVQLRVYKTITPGSQAMNYINGPASKDQAFFEYRMKRIALFRDDGGGLVAVAEDEKEFPVFHTLGEDIFESQNPELVERARPMTLKTCRSCHADAGIHSVQTRMHLVKPTVDQLEMESLGPEYGALFWETEDTLAWKQRHYDWGLLSGYWQAAGWHPGQPIPK